MNSHNSFKPVMIFKKLSWFSLISTTKLKVWDLAFALRYLEEVNGVQGDPADHEEEHNDGEVLGGFNFSLPGGSEHPQHAALGATTGAVHGHHLLQLQVRYKYISV